MSNPITENVQALAKIAVGKEFSALRNVPPYDAAIVKLDIAKHSAEHIAAVANLARLSDITANEISYTGKVQITAASESIIGQFLQKATGKGQGRA